MNQPLITEHTDLTEIVLNEGGRFLYPGDLCHYYRIVWHHLAERSRLNPDYHVRFGHTNHVFWEGMLGGIAAVNDGLMVHDELRDLGIGLLFHDVNRKQEKGVGDREQIMRARCMLRENILHEDRHRLPNCENIIQASLFEFPRVRLVEPTMAQMIMADVDLTQCLNRFYMDLVYTDLGLEFGKTPVEMIQMQEGFMRSIDFYTDWAKGRYGHLIEPKIAHVKRLLQIVG